MPQYTFAPWNSKPELLRIRNQIFPKGGSIAELQLQDQGMEEIRLWTLRGKCNTYITSTGLILAARRRWHTATSEPTITHLALASALERFVVGFTDPGHDAALGRSMVTVGLSLNIPRSVIATRHESTHHDLPSMKRLAAESQRAIGWLRNTYWDKLDAAIPRVIINHGVTYDQDRAMHHKAINYITGYRQRRRDAILQKIDTQAAVELEMVGALATGYNARQRPVFATHVATVLATEEKMLVPADRTLGDTMDGAFVLWTPLLFRLCVHFPRFIRTFVGVIKFELSGVGEGAGLARAEALVGWSLCLFGEERWWEGEGQRRGCWRKARGGMLVVLAQLPQMLLAWIKVEEHLGVSKKRKRGET